MRDSSSHAAAGISLTAIVAAALDVIRQAGVDGLTMRSVAERLKVRAPSLYHYVRNKDELLELVVRNAFDSFETDRLAYERVTTVDEWIAVTIAGSLRLRDFYRDHPGLARLIQSKAAPDRDAGQGSRAALVRAQLLTLVDLGIPESVAREVFETSAYWTIAAVAAEPAPGAGARSADFFAVGLELFMRGLKARLEDELSAVRSRGRSNNA